MDQPSDRYIQSCLPTGGHVIGGGESNGPTSEQDRTKNLGQNKIHNKHHKIRFGDSKPAFWRFTHQFQKMLLAFRGTFFSPLPSCQDDIVCPRRHVSPSKTSRSSSARWWIILANAPLARRVSLGERLGYLSSFIDGKFSRGGPRLLIYARHIVPSRP